MLEMVTAVVPELVMVTVCAALVMPTGCEVLNASAREVGAMVTVCPCALGASATNTAKPANNVHARIRE
jgi:cation transport ATPase